MQAGHFGLAPFDPVGLSSDYNRQAEVRPLLSWAPVLSCKAEVQHHLALLLTSPCFKVWIFKDLVLPAVYYIVFTVLLEAAYD
jgi:hypothetical protein